MSCCISREQCIAFSPELADASYKTSKLRDKYSNSLFPIIWTLTELPASYLWVSLCVFGPWCFFRLSLNASALLKNICDSASSTKASIDATEPFIFIIVSLEFSSAPYRLRKTVVSKLHKLWGCILWMTEFYKFNRDRNSGSEELHSWQFTYLSKTSVNHNHTSPARRSGRLYKFDVFFIPNMA